jgi:hypothetical protein
MDLKAARERREVAGAEDDSSIGGRGSGKDIGNLGRSAVTERRFEWCLQQGGTIGGIRPPLP